MREAATLAKCAASSLELAARRRATRLFSALAALAALAAKAAVSKATAHVYCRVGETAATWEAIAAASAASAACGHAERNTSEVRRGHVAAWCCEAHAGREAAATGEAGREAAAEASEVDGARREALVAAFALAALAAFASLATFAEAVQGCRAAPHRYGLLLSAALIRCDVEGDLIAFLRLTALTFVAVDEDVTMSVRLNKAEALLDIEEFHGSGNAHRCSLLWLGPGRMR